MALSEFGWYLVRHGSLSTEQALAADQRRCVYGGGFDTVLLEMGVLDEVKLGDRLVAATGLPLVPDDRLKSPDDEIVALLDADSARRLAAVPFARRDGAVQVAVHTESDRVAVADWASGRGMKLQLFIAPEVRLRQLLTIAYRHPLTARFSTLLGRLMNPEEVRRLRLERAPVPIAPPPVDTGPRPWEARAATSAETEIDITEEAPPTRLDASDLPVETLLATAAAGQQPADVLRAIAALRHLREPRAVPALAARLKDRKREIAVAAHKALVALTKQDFGTGRRSWNGWWEKARDRHRIEWLLDALAHKRADLRLQAEEELRELTGVYFGYHFDLPERDREEARRRWLDWWRTIGRTRFAVG